MSAVGLSTLGVQCGDTKALGMASLGVFCGIALFTPEDEFGGRQFPLLIFKPILEPLDSQLHVDKKVLPYIQTGETEFVIDGKKYDLVEKKKPSEIINSYDDVDKLLDKAVEKMGITRRKAKKELYNQVITKLKASEDLKESVFNDDEEIIMILVATDDL